MAVINESSEWSPTIFEVEYTTDVIGGSPIYSTTGNPIGGFANIASQQLANRSQYLLTRVLANGQAIETLQGQVGGLPTAGTTGIAVYQANSPAQGRTALGLGTASTQPTSAFQPSDNTLTGVAAVTTAADTLIYAAGVDTFNTTPLTAYARTLLDDTTSSAAKTTLSLGNVDNTSDALKPISTATQTALDLKANLVSPLFTGIPTAPTAIAGTNTTQLASTAFVMTAVASPAEFPAAYFTDERNGTPGDATTTTYDIRTLNTTRWNTITGASMTSSVITLPVGTYNIIAGVSQSGGGGYKARIYNITGAAVLGNSTAQTGGGDTNNQYSRVFVRTKFVLTSASTIRLEAKSSTASGRYGRQVFGGGDMDIFSDVYIEKVG